MDVVELIVMDDGLITSPAPGAVKVTTAACVPIKAATGLTVIVPAVPGPAVVLQLTVAAVAVMMFAALRLPAQSMSEMNAANVVAPRRRKVSESMNRTLLVELGSFWGVHAAD